MWGLGSAIASSISTHPSTQDTEFARLYDLIHLKLVRAVCVAQSQLARYAHGNSRLIIAVNAVKALEGKHALLGQHKTAQSHRHAERLRPPIETLHRPRGGTGLAGRGPSCHCDARHKTPKRILNEIDVDAVNSGDSEVLRLATATRSSLPAPARPRSATCPRPPASPTSVSTARSASGLRTAKVICQPNMPGPG